MSGTAWHDDECLIASDLDDRYRVLLTLLVSGGTALSTAAIGHARRLCDEHLGSNGELTILDVNDTRSGSLIGSGLAIPALVRTSPPPLHKVSGDLSDTHRVLAGLDLPTCRCFASAVVPGVSSGDDV